MATREATCADRIAENLTERERYASALFEAMDNDGGPDPDGTLVKNDDGQWVDGPAEVITADDASERLNEWPLGVSVERTIKVELSTGGPADYITATLTEDGPYNYRYHFADWFDHAEVEVADGSPLARLVDYYAEIVTD